MELSHMVKCQLEDTVTTVIRKEDIEMPAIQKDYTRMIATWFH